MTLTRVRINGSEVFRGDLGAKMGDLRHTLSITVGIPIELTLLVETKVLIVSVGLVR